MSLRSGCGVFTFGVFEPDTRCLQPRTIKTKDRIPAAEIPEQSRPKREIAWCLYVRGVVSLRSGYLNRIPAAEIPEQSKLKTGYPLPKSPNNQVYSEGSLLCRSPILRKVLVKLSTTVKLLIKGRFREVPKRDRIPASGRPGSAKTPETSSERLPYLTEVLQGKYWLNSVQPSKGL